MVVVEVVLVIVIVIVGLVLNPNTQEAATHGIKLDGRNDCMCVCCGVCLVRKIRAERKCRVC